MSFDAKLASRLEKMMTKDLKTPGLSESRMMGGFGYMMNGNMCLGIHRNTLIIRIGVDTVKAVLQEPYVRPMDLTGKVMRGWATLEPRAIEKDEDLKRYCKYVINFVKTLPKKSGKH